MYFGCHHLESLIIKIYSEGVADDDLLGYGCMTPATKRSLTYASLCDETSIRALISDDFAESGKCNFYTISDRYFVTGGVMALQVFSMPLIHWKYEVKF